MTQRKQLRPQPKSRQRNGCVHVPDDIVRSILLRLPVKSLMRFRCVCKSWYSSITSTNFISTHLNTRYNKDHGYMVHMGMATVFRDPPICPVVCDRTYCRTSKYPISFTFRSCHVEIVGSCNGLLCLFEHRRGRNWGNVIYLWNPSIRKFKRLPDSSLSGQYDQISNGFGYQSETNDYKVVKIYSYPTGDIMQNSIVAEVYTLSSDSWRKVGISLRPKVAVSSIETYSSATFVSGALHWLGYFNTEFKDLQSEKGILSFDVNNEKFGEIALPNRDTNYNKG
ncbi:F-box/kelch-repeat protein At3g23880-like [Quercus suber]|uniref:F-box/kelch-repeat protein At3g23880-like n=1 Tax=Quercus suber TaxID=58331 RepID=UPI0032DFE696